DRPRNRFAAPPAASSTTVKAVHALWAAVASRSAASTKAGTPYQWPNGTIRCKAMPIMPNHNVAAAAMGARPRMRPASPATKTTAKTRFNSPTKTAARSIAPSSRRKSMADAGSVKVSAVQPLSVHKAPSTASPSPATMPDQPAILAWMVIRVSSLSGRRLDGRTDRLAVDRRPAPLNDATARGQHDGEEDSRAHAVDAISSQRPDRGGQSRPESDAELPCEAGRCSGRSEQVTRRTSHRQRLVGPGEQPRSGAGHGQPPREIARAPRRAQRREQQ